MDRVRVCWMLVARGLLSNFPMAFGFINGRNFSKTCSYVRTNSHKSFPESLSLNCIWFSTGSESRERPGVLRAHHQAPHTAPSACEQSIHPLLSIFSFFFLPSSIFPKLPPLCICQLLLLASPSPLSHLLSHPLFPLVSRGRKLFPDRLRTG